MTGTAKKVGILGCGWLGLPLAERLLQIGFSVKGSTTTSDKLEILQARGIEPYQIRVEAQQITGNISAFLSGLNVLIIDFPPGIRWQPPEDFIRAIKRLIQSIRESGLKNVIFASSISVYEETTNFPTYTEDDAPKASSPGGMALIAAEELFNSEKSFSTSLLRLGGLIGGERHPIRQLSGRKGVGNPQGPVNLIHRNDCIGIVEALLLKGEFGQVFNAVYPKHPEKITYYTQKALEQGLLPPEFDSSKPSKGKIIASEKVSGALGYTFKVPI